MKREKFLWPLTQSHHRSLVMAKSLKQKLSQVGPATQDRLLREISEETGKFFQDELRRHFTEEHDIFWMLRRRLGAADPDLERIEEEHRLFESWIASPSLENLNLFAERIVPHIRFEEDVLFGRVEKLLTPDEKTVIGVCLRLSAHPPSCR